MSEHIKALEAARVAAVKQRRSLVGSMTAYQRGKTEDAMTAFINLQNLLKAIDDAIADENRNGSTVDAMLKK
jgi:hypothetical protein